MENVTLASDMTMTAPLPAQQQALTDLSGPSDAPSSVPTGQPGTETRPIPIDAIERDEGLQARAQLDAATMADYANDMQHDAAFPPIIVFQEDTEASPRYWLADGWHRVGAAERIGAKRIRAQVHHGTRRDALIYAAGANVKNGLRRTNADKRKAVELLLRDENLVKRSDSELGRLAGVDRVTVSHIRKQLETSCEIHTIEEKQVTRQGKTYTQRLKSKGDICNPELEHQDPHEPPTPSPQAQKDEERYDRHPQPEPAGASASDPQAEHDEVQSIDAARYDQAASLQESPEATAHHARVDPAPEASEHEGQPEAQEAPTHALAGLQGAQAPLSALHCLLDRFEDGVSHFRAQYGGDERIVDEALDMIQEALQHARHLLAANAQRPVYDGVDLKVDEPLKLEPDETLAPNHPKVQGKPSASQDMPTTAANPDAFAVVQAFVERRCTRSTTPVLHAVVMAAIHSWIDTQGLPPVSEQEAIDALHRLGFRDGQVPGDKRNRANRDDQWDNLQLLPADAPDDPIDPVRSREA